ncbi:hypothetical protein CJ178_31130 [Rhodococcus sp. ACPA4]|nr:hypothetical protein CJ178_31130 [Rhodococcus sp. ACPA4]
MHPLDAILDTAESINTCHFVQWYIAYGYDEAERTWCRHRHRKAVRLSDMTKPTKAMLSI